MLTSVASGVLGASSAMLAWRSVSGSASWTLAPLAALALLRLLRPDVVLVEAVSVALLALLPVAGLSAVAAVAVALFVASVAGLSVFPATLALALLVAWLGLVSDPSYVATPGRRFAAIYRDRVIALAPAASPERVEEALAQAFVGLDESVRRFFQPSPPRLSRVALVAFAVAWVLAVNVDAPAVVALVASTAYAAAAIE